MDDIDVSESFVQEEEDKNEFLDGDFKYQNCPHCQRNFFFGKLKYHLKLCKPNNPMTKSPLKKTKRSYISTALQKSEHQADQLQIQSPTSYKSPDKYKKCPYCRSTFPLNMLQKHCEKCNLKPNIDSNPQDLDKLKSKTKIDFGIKKDTKQPSPALPRIRNSAKQNKNVERKFVSQEVKDLKFEYTVKIREDLSCFKKALEVQQIQCQYCHRKFSKEASLRHIPICEKIKMQEMQQVALKKHSKSEIYKLNVPVKKSTLFRSKFLSNLSDKNDELEIKSARVFEHEKIERQKISNSSLVFKRQEKKQRRLSDLKPLFTKETEQSRRQISPQKNMLIHSQKQTPDLEMNMTFSKNLHNSSRKASMTVEISLKKNASERLPTFEKQEGINYFEENLFEKEIKDKCPVSKEETQGDVENEFLEVTVSKKKFFSDIYFENKEPILNKKLMQPELEEKDKQKMRLNIELKDLGQKENNRD